MKKFLSLLFVAVLSTALLCSCGSSGGDETGLRDIKWGMTRSELRKLETAEFVGAADSHIRFYDEDTEQPIVYLGVNTNNKVDLWYYFNTEDKLYKIEYRLSTTNLPTIHSYTSKSL